MCLENKPFSSFGTAVCGNGFVETGESCDCGGKDCSAVDPCCDGSTCKFADASYQCSNLLPCCSQCKFVTAASAKECRAAIGSCDMAEKCSGTHATCPIDAYAFPGRACSLTTSSGTFNGKCYAKKCNSLEETCTHRVGVTTSQSLDTTSSICSALNDPCSGYLVCHQKDAGSTKCKSAFTLANNGMFYSIPDGTPCLHSSDVLNTRTGFCKDKTCQLPRQLAAVPHCGNGGVDWGEECDCGSLSTDPNGCCNCATCQLNTAAACATIGHSTTGDGACCNSATCAFKAKGAVCRASSGECDVAETCSGSSQLCPRDLFQKVGTMCTSATKENSTCFAGGCLSGLLEQCHATTLGERSFKAYETHSNCQALMCCKQLSPSEIDCKASKSTMTIKGPEGDSDLTFSAAQDGTVLPTKCPGKKMCVKGYCTAFATAASCNVGQYLETARGECVACASGCADGCTGPTLRDCSKCAHGTAFKGLCPSAKVPSSNSSNSSIMQVPSSNSSIMQVSPSAAATTSASASAGSAGTTNPTAAVDTATKTLELKATIPETCTEFGTAGTTSFAESIKTSKQLKSVSSAILQVHVWCADASSRRARRAGSTLTAKIKFSSAVNDAALGDVADSLKGVELPYTPASGTTGTAKITTAKVTTGSSGDSDDDNGTIVVVIVVVVLIVLLVLAATAYVRWYMTHRVSVRVIPQPLPSASRHGRKPLKFSDSTAELLPGQTQRMVKVEKKPSKRKSGAKQPSKLTSHKNKLSKAPTKHSVLPTAGQGREGMNGLHTSSHV